MAQCARRAGMGRKVVVYPGVGGALLMPLLLAVRVCSVWKGEGGEIEEPSAYYFTSYACICCVSLKPYTVYNAGLLSQCWLALEVQVPLNPFLVACHRFKRIQADPLCLPEMNSEYALSWPAFADKLRLGVELRISGVWRPDRPHALQHSDSPLRQKGRLHRFDILC